MTTTAVARPQTVAVLSVHAGYGCRDRGVCCTSGWPIPIEEPALARAERAISERRLHVVRGTEPFLRRDDAPAGTPALLAVTAGGCAFHHGRGAPGCAIHHSLGHEALPLACRQFPRISVLTPRGVAVTLSHYCPTAAALIDDDRPVVIVHDATAFPAHAEYVGLDMRDGLPPALRPDMLMDWDAWQTWEHRTIALLGDFAADAALARLATAVAQTREWRPADGALGAAIHAAFISARRGAAAPVLTNAAADDRLADVIAAVPADLRTEALAAAARRSADTTWRAHQRFLMAHAFANWTAHLGEGLRSWLRSIEAAHALVVSGLSVSDADLLLRHLADPHALAERFSAAERE